MTVPWIVACVGDPLFLDNVPCPEADVGFKKYETFRGSFFCLEITEQ
jgi:hypothetical protein